MRKLFAKLHLWLSVPLGLLISVVCLSGAALVFEREITRAMRPDIYRVSQPENATPLPPSEIASRIRAQVADTLRLSSLLIPDDPEEAWMAGFDNVRKQTLSVNPYTGDINGWTESVPFFQTMRKLHRWLMDAPPQKGMGTTGKTLVGITTLVMIFILISGLVIWIPRNRRALKNRLRVSYTKGWRRFWYDSHVALGFYATLFLLVMALTGLTWSFSWYRTAAYALFGGGTDALPKKETKGKEGKKPSTRENFDFAVWDHAFASAKAAYPTYKSVKLGTGSLEVAPDPSSYLRKTDKLTFNKQTGNITAIARHADAPASQTLKSWFYAFHTGSWGGPWTQTLYFLAAVIGGILPLSGYYLWYKRTRAARKGNSSHSGGFNTNGKMN